MKLTLTKIGGPAKAKVFETAVAEYMSRIGHYTPVASKRFETLVSFQGWLQVERRRQAVATVLLDSRGKQVSSEHFAALVGNFRDSGRRQMVLAIGPANGWEAKDLEQADLLLSLGVMTLPHTLAFVVLLEQVYRAFTILNGHPYHAGH